MMASLSAGGGSQILSCFTLMEVTQELRNLSVQRARPRCGCSCRSHRGQNVQLQLVHGLPANATFGELLQSQVSRNDFSKHGCLGVGRHVAHAVEMGDGVRGRATNRFGARKLVLPGENQTQIVPGSATALGEPADLAHGGMRDPPRFRSLLEEKGLQSITCRSLTTT